VQSAHLPRDSVVLLYPTRSYSDARLNLPLMTPMLPVIVSASATILLHAIAM
jgi:hypothetical protein